MVLGKWVFTVCKITKSPISTGINRLQCRKGGYILQKFVCDGRTDCPNDSGDEDFCFCNQVNKKTLTNNSCKVFKVNQSILHCTGSYYVGIKGSCEKYDSNDNNILDNFFCSNIGHCSMHQKNISFTLLSAQENVIFPCRPSEIPCIVSTTCFNLNDICLYKLNTENQIIPCKTGDQLQNCVKFECNTFYKCPGYYCIPWSYVCDGKWNCPFGEDETKNDVCTEDTVSHNLFKCSNVVKCIHLTDVCDDKPDCPKDDDEMFCDLKLVQCPESCTCLTYSITCSKLAKVNRLQADILVHFLKITISNSIIDAMSVLEQNLQGIYFVYLPKNKMNQICPILFLKKLILLDLQFNYLSQIKEKCFSLSIFLRYLKLNDNNISYLYIFSFHNLHHLRFLDLSANHFIILPSKCFYSLLSLKVIHFGKMKFKEIHLTTFSYLHVNIIRTVDYKLSCICLHVTYCTSNPPYYVLCSNILPGKIIKVTNVIVSFLTISLNVLSVLLHVKKNLGDDFFKMKVN